MSAFSKGPQVSRRRRAVCGWGVGGWAWMVGGPLLAQAPPPLEVRGAAPAPVEAPVVEVFGEVSGAPVQAWIESLRAQGWTVRLEPRPLEQMPRVKRWLSLPSSSSSVWVARMGPYFLDGRVPAQTVGALWRQRPALRGLIQEEPSGGLLQVGHDGVPRPAGAF